MENKINSTQIEVESLSREIGAKSALVAKLQAQAYKFAAENEKLKNELKKYKKSGSAKAKRGKK